MKKKSFCRVLAGSLILIITMGMIFNFEISALTQSEYKSKYTSFINDSRWKHGISWSGSQLTKQEGASKGVQGCAAYAADFEYYVYGKIGWTGSVFKTPNSISNGSILHITPVSGGQHWLVVLERSGNTLYTAEGAVDSSVKITDSRYRVSNGCLQQYGYWSSGEWINAWGNCEMRDSYNYSISGSGSTSSVTVERYSASDSISDTNAILWGQVNKGTSQAVQQIGIKIRKINDTYANGWSKFETPSKSYVGDSCMRPYYNLNTELNLTLVHATTYYFKFYAKVDGTEYWSSEYSFKTTGSHSYSTYVSYSSSHPHYKNYKCSCGAIKENQNTTTFVSTCETCLNTVRPDKPTLNVNGNGFLENKALTFTWSQTDSKVTSYRLCFDVYNTTKSEYVNYDNITKNVTSGIQKSFPAGKYRVVLLAYNSKYHEVNSDEELHSTSATYNFTIKKPTIGDGNSDGKIDAQDLALLINILVKRTQANSIFDVNCDGVVNILDIVRIKKYLANGTPLGKIENPWGEWTVDTSLKSNSLYEFESKTQYSYSDKSTQSSSSSTTPSGWTFDYSTWKWGSYGSWTSWSTSYVAKDDYTDVETTTLYRWYAFVCPSCGAHDPYNSGNCSGCNADKSKLKYTEFWSTKSWYDCTVFTTRSSGTYKTKYTTSTDRYERWYSEWNTAPTTGYRYRTRSKVYTYYYYKWSSYSNWSDTVYTASSTRRIKTRTLYRYRLK